MSGEPDKQADTKNRILDAAETLFSECGFGDVSLRQITTEAGVNIAAVNYHFGSKDKLVIEVMDRVVTPINRQRLALLEEAEAKYGDVPVPVEEILEAMHRPVVDQLKDSGLQTSVYLRLAGRCLSESADHLSDGLVGLFQEVIGRVMAALAKTLPHLSDEDIFWRMHLSFGTMVYALTHEDRLPLISRGAFESSDPEETLQQLIEFTAGGLKAAAGAKKKKAKPERVKAGATITAIAALALLSSCKSASPEDAKHLATIKAPAHWVAGPTWRPSHWPDHHWIENFSSPPLTSYIERVLEHNKDLKGAQSRIEIALANARIIGADLYPQIDGGLSGQRSLQNFIGFPFGGPGGNPGVLSSRSNQFGLSLNMSWELDLWGRIRAAKSAAVAEFEQSQFDRGTAQLSIAGQAAKSWFALAEARDQAELARDTITIYSETERLIRDRFEAGIEEGGQGFASQLLLAEADVENAKETLQTRLELVGRTSRQMEVLAGAYPEGREGTAASLPGYPGKVPADIPATLLDRRPDLASAERRIAAADKRLLEARRSLLPTIGLTSSFGTTSEDFSNLLDSDFTVWSVAGNLAQPILQGGRLRANISKRDAELDLAVTEYEQAALTAFSEVENALAAEAFYNQRVSALLKSARLSRDAYQRSLEEFSGGTGDVLTVLSAQQRTFAAESQLLSVRRMRLDNRVDLYLALGGSFRHCEPVPEKTPQS